jgi:hypothetical protein
MKTTIDRSVAAAISIAVAAIWAAPAAAQEIEEPDLDALVARVQKELREEQDAANDIEEVVVTGRFISSSQ